MYGTMSIIFQRKRTLELNFLQSCEYNIIKFKFVPTLDIFKINEIIKIFV